MSVQEKEIPVFQLTLEAVRTSCGYSVEEAAQYCGISTQEMEQIEGNTDDMTVSIMQKIGRLYGVPVDIIYGGSASECISQNREAAALRMAPRKEAI